MITDYELGQLTYQNSHQNWNRTGYYHSSSPEQQLVPRLPLSSRKIGKDLCDLESEVKHTEDQHIIFQ